MVLRPPFLSGLEFGNVAFCGVGKVGEPGEKPLRAREKTNDKFNPHMSSTLRASFGGRGGDSNHRRALINPTHKKGVKKGG